MNRNLYELLYNEISKMHVIDTHEHLTWDENGRINSNDDILCEYLIQYLSSDIISSGMKRIEFNKLFDTSVNICDRFKLVEQYWDYCRHTGYGRALDISVKAIYGVDGIYRDTIEELNRLFLENKKDGHYKRVLHDLCNIEDGISDDWCRPYEYGDKCFNGYFRRVWQPSYYITPNDSSIFEYIEKHMKISVKTLDDWLNAFESELSYYINTYGFRVLKTAIAYDRTLRFEKVDYKTANSLFDESMNKLEKGSMFNFPLELQDFMMHYMLKAASKYNITVQFHTGLLEGNGNVLTNSDPTLLTNLFIEYPDVDFDLFHISYPYYNVSSALAKMFPNVFIDMCWAHIISPAACVAALDDFLDAVPYNKISGFGGDFCFVDGVYGHLELSRRNISRTLERKVLNGVFDEDRALIIAKALYHDNPKRIFKL